MFQLDCSLDGGWLTPGLWQHFHEMFGESGYEVYVANERVEQPEEPVAETRADVIRFHTQLELITNAFWRLKEQQNEEEIDSLLEYLKNAVTNVNL
jgi:uncharacterized short protein YbdD (DUF466 family)